MLKENLSSWLAELERIDKASVISALANSELFDTDASKKILHDLHQKLEEQIVNLQKYLQNCPQQQDLHDSWSDHVLSVSSVLRQFPVAIAILDRQLRYLLVSDRWLEYFQLTATRVINHNYYQVFPQIPQYWREDYQNCLIGKIEYLIREEANFVQESNPDWLRWEVLPWQNHSGETAGLFVIAQVKTQQKFLPSDQEISKKIKLAQIILHSLGDAVLSTNSQGYIEYLNPMAEKLTGWQTIEAQKHHLTEVFKIIHESSRQPIKNSLQKIFQIQEASQLSEGNLLIARNGQEYAIEGLVSPMKTTQGKFCGVAIIFRDVTKARKIAAKLSWQANHDPLTQLYNRRNFQEQVALAINRCQKHQACNYVVAYLDLDRFKIVNDTCGHRAGDELLRQITKLLQKRIRTSDIFARIGGDEFGILFCQCSLVKAQEISCQLVQIVREFRFIWEEKVFKIGVSVGLAAIDCQTQSVETLIGAVDTACYAAKAEGGNQVSVYQPQNSLLAQQSEERQWRAKLDQALAENRFCLYAQKIVHLGEENDSMEDCHYEILLRLIDESGSLITPGAFLPTAERYGLMPAIDRWVVSTFLVGYEVYYQSLVKQQSSTVGAMYTLNLSGASINSSEFGDFLQRQLQHYAFPPESICFEITETVAISNLEQATNLFHLLKKLGCRIALDDFGSGMSSFNYLKHLPVDYLKIDGSFVTNIASDPIDYATVESFNHVSQIMNIKTIAEFVEDNTILQTLKQIGVDYAQGYGIEPPYPLAW